MNRLEAIALCRYAKACCPQQAIDDYTPDAWFDLLADVGFEEAKAATKTVAMRQPFVAPAEIRAEINRKTTERVKAISALSPPAEIEAIEDEVEFSAAYLRWMRTAQHAIDNGVQPPTRQSAPLAIDAGPAAAIKAQMQHDARELVRKHSLHGADARAKAAEKRSLYAAIRAAKETA